MDDFDPLETRQVRRGHPDFERVEAIARDHGFRVVDIFDGSAKNGEAVGLRLALPERATIDFKKERALTKALADAGIQPWSSLKATPG